MTQGNDFKQLSHLACPRHFGKLLSLALANLCAFFAFRKIARRLLSSKYLENNGVRTIGNVANIGHPSAP
jgi:hypothetical protein